MPVTTMESNRFDYKVPTLEDLQSCFRKWKRPNSPILDRATDNFSSQDNLDIGTASHTFEYASLSDRDSKRLKNSDHIQSSDPSISFPVSDDSFISERLKSQNNKKMPSFSTIREFSAKYCASDSSCVIASCSNMESNASKSVSFTFPNGPMSNSEYKVNIFNAAGPDISELISDELIRSEGSQISNFQSLSTQKQEEYKCNMGRTAKESKNSFLPSIEVLESFNSSVFSKDPDLAQQFIDNSSKISDSKMLEVNTHNDHLTSALPKDNLSALPGNALDSTSGNLETEQTGKCLSTTSLTHDFMVDYSTNPLDLSFSSLLLDKLLLTKDCVLDSTIEKMKRISNGVKHNINCILDDKNESDLISIHPSITFLRITLYACAHKRYQHYTKRWCLFPSNMKPREIPFEENIPCKDEDVEGNLKESIPIFLNINPSEQLVQRDDDFDGRSSFYKCQSSAKSIPEAQPSNINEMNPIYTSSGSSFGLKDYICESFIGASSDKSSSALYNSDLKKNINKNTSNKIRMEIPTAELMSNRIKKMEDIPDIWLSGSPVAWHSYFYSINNRILDLSFRVDEYGYNYAKKLAMITRDSTIVIYMSNNTNGNFDSRKPFDKPALSTSYKIDSALPKYESSLNTGHRDMLLDKAIKSDNAFPISENNQTNDEIKQEDSRISIENEQPQISIDNTKQVERASFCMISVNEKGVLDDQKLTCEAAYVNDHHCLAEALITRLCEIVIVKPGCHVGIRWRRQNFAFEYYVFKDLKTTDYYGLPDEDSEYSGLVNATKQRSSALLDSFTCILHETVQPTVLDMEAVQTAFKLVIVRIERVISVRDRFRIEKQNLYSKHDLAKKPLPLIASADSHNVDKDNYKQCSEKYSEKAISCSDLDAALRRIVLLSVSVDSLKVPVGNQMKRDNYSKTTKASVGGTAEDVSLSLETLQSFIASAGTITETSQPKFPWLGNDVINAEKHITSPAPKGSDAESDYSSESNGSQTAPNRHRSPRRIPLRFSSTANDIFEAPNLRSLTRRREQTLRSRRLASRRKQRGEVIPLSSHEIPLVPFWWDYYTRYHKTLGSLENPIEESNESESEASSAPSTFSMDDVEALNSYSPEFSIDELLRKAFRQTFKGEVASHFKPKYASTYLSYDVDPPSWRCYEIWRLIFPTQFMNKPFPNSLRHQILEKLPDNSKDTVERLWFAADDSSDASNFFGRSYSYNDLDESSEDSDILIDSFFLEGSAEFHQQQLNSEKYPQIGKKIEGKILLGRPPRVFRGWDHVSSSWQQQDPRNLSFSTVGNRNYSNVAWQTSPRSSRRTPVQRRFFRSSNRGIDDEDYNRSDNELTFGGRKPLRSKELSTPTKILRSRGERDLQGSPIDSEVRRTSDRARRNSIVPIGHLPTGVYFDVARRLWRCQWRENGKFKTKGFSLGHYASLEEARRACILFRCEVGGFAVEPEWLIPVYTHTSLASKKVCKRSLKEQNLDGMNSSTPVKEPIQSEASSRSSSVDTTIQDQSFSSSLCEGHAPPIEATNTEESFDTSLINADTQPEPDACNDSNSSAVSNSFIACDMLPLKEESIHDQNPSMNNCKTEIDIFDHPTVDGNLSAFEESIDFSGIPLETSLGAIDTECKITDSVINDEPIINNDISNLQTSQDLHYDYSNLNYSTSGMSTRGKVKRLKESESIYPSSSVISYDGIPDQVSHEASDGPLTDSEVQIFLNSSTYSDSLNSPRKIRKSLPIAKGIYFDQGRKLWRVQYIVNNSIKTKGFSVARLGQEGAKKAAQCFREECRALGMLTGTFQGKYFDAFSFPSFCENVNDDEKNDIKGEIIGQDDEGGILESDFSTEDRERDREEDIGEEDSDFMYPM